MKSFYLFFILILFVACKNDSDSTMSDNSMNESASKQTMRGTWKQISFYNYADNKVVDTIKASESNKQIKMYSETKVMWSRFREADSIDWFGYGNYTIGDGVLTEVIDYGSKAMNEAIKEDNEFSFKLILEKDNFTQIEMDEEGNFIYAEHYVRIE